MIGIALLLTITLVALGTAATFAISIARSGELTLPALLLAVPGGLFVLARRRFAPLVKS